MVIISAFPYGRRLDLEKNISFSDNLLGSDDPHAAQDGEHDRGGNDGAHLTPGVCTHGVHEEVALLIVFLAFLLHDPGRHWKSRDSRGADKRIDLHVTQDPQDFTEQQAAGCIQADRKKTKA